MKSKFVQLSVNTFNIKLIPESLEDVELLLYFDIEDEEQENTVQCYYDRAIELKFGESSFMAFMQASLDYPKSVVCIIKDCSLIENRNINLN